MYIWHFETSNNLKQLPNFISMFLITLFIPFTGEIIKHELLLFSVETISFPNSFYFTLKYEG